MKTDTRNTKTANDVLREIVRLHDAGITPQILQGNKRECDDLEAAIFEAKHILSNVRDDGSPLAFGADPASAGSVTKVPKAW